MDTPFIPFTIAAGSTEPIYRQLIDQVRRLVASGQLAPGDAMPSVRDIAHALALNPMTVSKAYSLLELEGLLVRQRGKGMQVAERKPGSHSASARMELLRPSLERVVQEARQLELDPEAVLAALKKQFKEK